MSLTMPKHTSEEFTWYPPIELVSAHENFNVDSIWKQAVAFKESMGRERIAKRRSQ